MKIKDFLWKYDFENLDAADKELAYWDQVKNEADTESVKDVIAIIHAAAELTCALREMKYMPTDQEFQDRLAELEELI